MTVSAWIITGERPWRDGRKSHSPLTLESLLSDTLLLQQLRDSSYWKGRNNLKPRQTTGAETRQWSVVEPACFTAVCILRLNPQLEFQLSSEGEIGSEAMRFKASVSSRDPRGGIRLGMVMSQDQRIWGYRRPYKLSQLRQNLTSCYRQEPRGPQR